MAESVRPTVAEPAATRADGTAPPAVPAWRIGDVIDGTYEVRDLFTAGGMGLVYHVRHLGWGLDLAVKQPRAEFFRTEGQRADFEREAEAWADLGLHPNVVTCHYVRRLGGVPCVFAEFAIGGSLADQLRDDPLPLAVALDAAIQTAWGLDHAHARGLIHQDIKPANLLVADESPLGEPRETRPDSAVGLAAVKVTDFGLAAARAAVETGTGTKQPGRTLAVAGAGLFTPEYAAPEQFAGQPLTRRTDVWAWAVTLLELLTGRRPAVGIAAPELLAVVGRTDWPAGLGELLADCLALDADARPRDMTAVAARAVECFERLTGTRYPRRPPRTARFDLDAKNNRAVSLLDLGKAEEAETLWTEVVRAERDHPEAGYNLGMARWRANRAGFEELTGDLREVAAAFPDDPRAAVFAARVQLEAGNADEATAALGSHSDEVEVAAIRAAIRTHAAKSPKQAWASDRAGSATAVAWAGKVRIVTAHRDRTVRVWDAGTGQPVHVLTGHDGIPDRLVASEDGQFLLSTAFSEDPTGAAELTLWGLTAGTRLWTITGREQGRDAGSIVPLATDGELVVAFVGNSLVGWSRGEVLFDIPDAGHAAYPGGVIVTTAGDSETLTARVWELPEPRPVSEFELSTDARDLTVTADGRFLTARVRGRLRHWSLPDGAEATGPPPGTAGFAVETGGPVEYTDHLLTVRQAATDRPVAVFAPHGPNSGLVAALGPDGRFATAWEHGVAVWQLDPTAEPYSAPPAVCRARRSEAVLAAEEAFDAELAAANTAMVAADWVSAAGHVRAARRQPGSDRRADALALWGQLSERLARGGFRRGWWADSFATPGARDLALTPDGRTMIVSEHLRFKVWDVGAARAVAETETPTGRTVAIAPDGATVYTTAGVGGRKLRLTATEVATGRTRWSADLPPLTVGFGELRLSGDGATLFSVHGDHSVRRWDAATGALLTVYSRRLDGLASVAPSADGRWFAAVGFGDGAVRVIESASGRCRRTLLRAGGACVAVAGNTVIVGRVPGEGPGLHLSSLPPEDVLTCWDAGSGARVRSFKGPLPGAGCVAVSTDGGLLVAGYKGGAAAWDAETGELLREFPTHGDEVRAVAAADGRRRVFTAAGESVRVWALDWELTDRPFEPPAAPATVAWGDGFEPAAFAVAAPSIPAAAPTPLEPLVLATSKLVLTADALHRGKQGGPLEQLHPLTEVTGVELVRHGNVGAAVVLASSVAVGAVGYLGLDGGWEWAAVVAGVILLLFGAGQWRFPVLRVMTTAGTHEYEIRDPADDATAFAASIHLATGGRHADP